jgi:Zn ribbon nucleic-acid-binding protein
MTGHGKVDLWRNCPKTATEFEARFATEEDFRAYGIKARWGDAPSCAKCASTRLWTTRNSSTFECADCGHQTCSRSSVIPLAQDTIQITSSTTPSAQ